MIKNTLNLIEIFSSIQGESSFSGLPTTFIRLAACNLRCRWCDTPYSFGRGNSVEFEAILDEVSERKNQNVCVTGGEPLLQKNVYPLMTQLVDLGYTLSLETSGSVSTEQVDKRVHTILDIKCPASGMSHKNEWSNLSRLQKHDEIKFVLVNREDYEFAKQVLQEHRLDEQVKEVLFSPAYNLLEPQQLVQWILEDKLKVRLNLQIHKFIWAPHARGV